MMRVVGVIPARWGSTRFPGKSLADIAGRTLVAWVAATARHAGSLDELLVATDDERIAAAAEAAGAEAVMTSAGHPSGTDRVAEAVSARKADIIVNIQGDEPVLDESLIDRLTDRLEKDERWDMATAAYPIDSEEVLNNPAAVKVVCDRDGRALYFSRAPIPFVRDGGGDGETGPFHFRHLGIYAYRRTFLDRLVSEKPCAMEKAEKLEQLRALYIGGAIAVEESAADGLGVDTPEDAKRAEKVLKDYHV
ncbi:MAG: 3-deoxy-manno-octulosonate cytidylyltransferase [Kiritimatiellia bacterium]